MQFYAGIGSRETPHDIQKLMAQIAERLHARGFTLRSGGAEGADSAFSDACLNFGGPTELWLPWHGYNDLFDGFLPQEKHFEVAKKIHPIFGSLTQGAQKLHARNVGQILGNDFDQDIILAKIAAKTDDPVDSPLASEFVVCWTNDGAEHRKDVNSKTGGTGSAIKLASHMGIPIFNLKKKDAIERLNHFFNKVKI